MPRAVALGALLLFGLLPALWIPPRAAGLLLNTAWLALAAAISLPPGTALAWLIARTDLPGRSAAAILLGTMLFVPLYLQAAAWQAGFGLQGWYTLSGASVWLSGWPGAIWIHTLAALPWVVLAAGAGFRQIEPELEEQALLDGTPRQVFFRLELPSAAGAIGVAALWVVIWTAGEMTVTDLFAVRTYAEEIYTQLVVEADANAASLGIWPGVLLTAWLMVAACAMLARLAPRGRPASLGPARVFALGIWRWPAVAAVLVVLGAVVGVPLASLIYKAGVLVTQTDAGRERTFSAAKCLAVVVESPWRYQLDLGWSLAIGALAATAAVVIAAVAAWAVRRRPRRVAWLVGICALLVATPGPALGLAIVRLLNRPELPLLAWLYNQSILAPWLALTLRALPPAVLVLWHAAESLPQEMLDAATVDGATPWGACWRIALACRLPALGVAWLVALAVALGDLAASILVAPPGVMILSRRIFGLMHYGVEDVLAGICLALFLFFAANAAAAAGLAWWWARRARG